MKKKMFTMIIGIMLIIPVFLSAHEKVSAEKYGENKTAEFVSDAYGNRDSVRLGTDLIEAYLPNYKNVGAELLVYLSSYENYDYNELVENGILNPDEWRSGEHLYYFDSNYNNKYLTMQGELFGLHGKYELTIYGETNVLGEVSFLFDDVLSIRNMVLKLCDLTGRKESTDNYKKSVSGQYYPIFSDNNYYIGAEQTDGNKRFSRIEITNKSALTDYLSALREEDYKKNFTIYDNAVAGYWKLHDLLKNPSSLVFDGIVRNGNSIIYKFRGTNSFGGVVTEFAKYENGIISTDYADAYYLTADEELSWYTIRKFSQSTLCTHKPISG